MKTVLFTLAILAAVGTVTVTQEPTTEPATQAIPVAAQVPTKAVEPTPEVKSDLDDLLTLKVEIEQPTLF